MAMKTLTNKNMSAAQNAGPFSGPHLLCPLAQWFFCALPQRRPPPPPSPAIPLKAGVLA